MTKKTKCFAYPEPLTCSHVPFFEVNQNAYILFCKIERQDKVDLSNSKEKIQVLISEFVTFIFICIMIVDTFKIV